MQSARTIRINQLKSNLGTVRETPMTKVRISEYEVMTDVTYEQTIAKAMSASASRMASELFKKVK